MKREELEKAYNSYISMKRLLFTEYWVSGNYKIIKYDVGYFAYYRPTGWQVSTQQPRRHHSWGKSVQMREFGLPVVYPTLKAAKDACAKHMGELVG